VWLHIEREMLQHDTHESLSLYLAPRPVDGPGKLSNPFYQTLSCRTGSKEPSWRLLMRLHVTSLRRRVRLTKLSNRYQHPSSIDKGGESSKGNPFFFPFFVCTTPYLTARPVIFLSATFSSLFCPRLLSCCSFSYETAPFTRLSRWNVIIIEFRKCPIFHHLYFVSN
jgi:hypothetical protein